MCPIGCSSDCSCGSKTGISCIISRSHCGNRTGISCISSSQQRAAYLEFLASFLVDVELVFLALTVVNWSLNEADNRDNECNQLASLRQHSRRLLSSLSSLSEVKSLMIKIHGIFQRWCSLGKGHCKVEG